MKYKATKPLYLSEADWCIMPKGEDPKEYSFPPIQHKDKDGKKLKPDDPPTAIHDLPDNEFIHSLAAEKLLIAVEAPKKSGRKLASELKEE